MSVSDHELSISPVDPAATVPTVKYFGVGKTISRFEMLPAYSAKIA